MGGPLEVLFRGLLGTRDSLLVRITLTPTLGTQFLAIDQAVKSAAWRATARCSAQSTLVWQPGALGKALPYLFLIPVNIRQPSAPSPRLPIAHTLRRNTDKAVVHAQVFPFKLMPLDSHNQLSSHLASRAINQYYSKSISLCHHCIL